MALVVRKIGLKEYAYRVQRIEGKVVHTYVGALDKPQVQALIGRLRERKKIPSFLHALFWDVRPETIHLQKHSRYIIERVLAMGSLKAMAWAQRLYPTVLILEVAGMSRSVSEQSRNFWRIWLGEEPDAS